MDIQNVFNDFKAIFMAKISEKRGWWVVDVKRTFNQCLDEVLKKYSDNNEKISNEKDPAK